MRALVVYAHPIEDSYCASLRDRVVHGLETAGHDVDLLDLYAEAFDPILTDAERAAHLEPPSAKPELAADFERLRSAELIVMVYPTWWGAQPAILKGWLDRVWANEIAFRIPDGANRIRPALRHVRRIAVVTTHGSSKFINSLEGEPGKRIVGRSLRLLCGWRARFRWIAFYGMDGATEAARTAFLHKVEQKMARL
jgi:NAD(P)H dehydrogenase (quinone)